MHRIALTAYSQHAQCCAAIQPILVDHQQCSPIATSGNQAFLQTYYYWVCAAADVAVAADELQQLVLLSVAGCVLQGGSAQLLQAHHMLVLHQIQGLLGLSTKCQAGTTAP
jgi:hypothetical protein